jgi:hypothetical protein
MRVGVREPDRRPGVTRQPLDHRERDDYVSDGEQVSEQQRKDENPKTAELDSQASKERTGPSRSSRAPARSGS